MGGLPLIGRGPKHSSKVSPSITIPYTPILYPIPLNLQVCDQEQPRSPLSPEPGPVALTRPEDRTAAVVEVHCRALCVKP